MKPANRKFSRSNNFNDGQHRHRNGGGGGNTRNASAAREKYINLSREALAAGDRILAEYYSQHAEHYYRVMAEEGPRPQQPQGNRQGGRHPQQNPAVQGEARPVEGEAADGNVHYIASNEPIIPGTTIPAPAMYPNVAAPRASEDAVTDE